MLKRIFIAAVTVLGFTIPTFIPTSWVGIEASEWEPLPWPGMDVTIGEEPEPLEVADIPGIIGHRIWNKETGFQARFMSIPGTETLNAETIKTVKSAIAAQETFSNKQFEPEAHKPGAGLADRYCVTGSTTWSANDIVNNPSLGVASNGTAVVCDVFLASGSHIGQKLRVVSAVDGAIVADETFTSYLDAATQSSMSGEKVWGEGAAQFVWDSYVAAMKREVGAVGLTWVSGAFDEALMKKVLAGTIVDAEQVYVTFPKGISAAELQSVGIAETDSAVTLVIPVKTVRQVLSKEGLEIVGVAKSGLRFETPWVPAGFDHFDCSIFSCVSLTYDDGPSYLTPGILDALAANHASATFYVLGSLVENNSDIVLRAYNEGHLVQNHSWSHKDLTKIPLSEAAAEINQTNTVIYDITGVVPQTYRPPYGSINEKLVKEIKMTAILWDVDTNDWQGPEHDELVARAVHDAHPGSIILQHDIHDNTAETVWDVIAGLRDRGFEMVNVEQLFNGSIPQGSLRSAR